MSLRELKRIEMLSQVRAGALTLRAASTVLGVSERHAKRLWKRFRQRGPAGLRHRQVGRPSNRRTPAALRRRVLALVRREFGGDATHARFGPTLAAEHLHEEYGLTVDAETLRRWMLAAGLWSRARRGTPHRQRRVRRAHFGELVQLDGSFEPWLEDRGPVACAMALVDDATSTTLLRFEPQETIWGAVRTLRQWVTRYGLPQALYTDWKNVYVRKPTEAEAAAGEVPRTQFGRMCAALGIRIIAASSPQAKGRVERSHGTHQDRLVKKLRRLGVTDYAAANAYLETTYLAAHNQRFARRAADAGDFHTPVPKALDLDTIFRLEESRTLSADWVVRYANRYLQVVRQSRYPPATTTVTVWEAEDGRLGITYRGQAVRFTEIPPPVPVAGSAKPPGQPALVPPRRGRPVAADHPWKQGFIGLRDRVSPGESIPGRWRTDGSPTSPSADHATPAR
jgi:transposase